MSEDNSTVESLATGRGGWAGSADGSPRRAGAPPATAISKSGLMGREAYRLSSSVALIGPGTRVTNWYTPSSPSRACSHVRNPAARTDATARSPDPGHTSIGGCSRSMV
jgi:hypothetical protein